MLHALVLYSVSLLPQEPLRWTHTIDNAIVRFYSNDNVEPTYNSSGGYVDFGAINQSFSGYLTVEEHPVRFFFKLILRTRNASASTTLDDGFRYEYGKPKPNFLETRLMDVIYQHDTSVPFTEIHFYPSDYVFDRTSHILDTVGNLGRPRPIYQNAGDSYYSSYIAGFGGFVRARNDTDPFWFERN